MWAKWVLHLDRRGCITLLGHRNWYVSVWARRMEATLGRSWPVDHRLCSGTEMVPMSTTPCSGTTIGCPITQDSMAAM
jgi:hypothetical protein